MKGELKQATQALLARWSPFPETVIVLGSGMSKVLDRLQVEGEMGFRDIPHVPGVGVEGHTGVLRVGVLAGKRVAVAQGRVHFYEGHSMATVVLPWRAMALAGAKRFFLTNAAGGIRKGIRPMSLMLIRDHINAMGTNPLVGPNLSELGPRFPDLSQMYDSQLREQFRSAAAKLGIELPEGVYIGVHGPSYETPAEIHAYRLMGADLVGMSTVPEAIALHHMGVKVAAVSCVTNLAAGASQGPLDHAEVLENAGQAHAALGKLLEGVLADLVEA